MRRQAADAKLIALAERIIAAAAAREAIPVDRDMDEATARLVALVDGLVEMKPCTPAGWRAKASAVLALGHRYADRSFAEICGKRRDLMFAVAADARRIDRGSR